MRPALLKTFSPEMFLASLCLHPPFVFHFTSILPNPSLPTLPGHPPVQGILQQSNNAHQGFGLEQCCCSWRCAPYNLVPGKPKPRVTLGISGFDGKSVYCRSSSHMGTRFGTPVGTDSTPLGSTGAEWLSPLLPRLPGEGWRNYTSVF